uniref:Fibronectin type III domain-containing protein 7 n=1 Tax=Cyprinus carpio carpio TaxID=630221 RepID=A0A9J8D0Q5_CYPCA
MHLPGTLFIFVTLFSVAQVIEATTANCNITSILSPTASSLLVKWNTFPGASSYTLDVRAVNSNITAPITITLAASIAERLVQGLRPGQIYLVTFRVFVLNHMSCINSMTAQTIPATSQITYSKAISSTSIRFEWSSAQGADKYILVVNGTFHPETQNLTFTTLSGQVDNLQEATSYSCYVYSANSAGLGSKSLVKTIRTLVQPPNNVAVRELPQNMAHVTWNSVSGVVLYQVSVTANNKPGFPLFLKNVTGTAVNISNLEPCTTYTIGVASINMFLEPGEFTNVTFLTSTISTASSISVEYSCLTSTAVVSWDVVFGATLYNTVITDGQGRSFNCTSTDTTCQFLTLVCGERYTVRITAIANCESTSDGSYVFETAPCSPKALKLYRECSTNVILLSWDSTNNTAYYFAIAVDSNQLVTECLTVDTACYFTDTVCGQTYSFYVRSIFSGGLDCNSGYTDGVVIKTSPCLPQNIYTIANCDSISSAVITWHEAAGAETYIVEARGNRKDFYNCSSTNTSCTLTDLVCGESLSVWIVATNGDCTTDPVLGEVAETVPCIPQNVSAVKTCSSESASLTWNNANGAILYIGTATHIDGTVHTCAAMAAECTFPNLRCGETYDVKVKATNLQCNSSESQHVTLQTAPCAPVSVVVTRDCAANHVIASWQALQNGSLYTAVLQDEHGPTVNCSTSSNNCTFTNLLCGMNYNITVTRNDGQCRSLPSTPIQIQSAPCDPQNITTVLQCDTNTANVTWAASAGANGYTAMATDRQQQRLASCQSMGTSCQLTSLPCGIRLNVTVQADGTTCNSSSQPKAVVETAPCIPTNVSATLNCTSNIASITWHSALGATWYLVKAVSSQGYKTSCNNTVTHCDMPNLQCGQEYSITVTGMNGVCMGPASQPVTLVSAPCHNTGIQASLDCRTNSALISWTPGNGTLSFNATLQSFQDPQKHSCFTNGSSCNIGSLPCGQHYNISVTGYGQTCSTCSKTLVTLDTAPCVPTKVNVSLSCGSDTASVFWAASSGRVSYYTVTAVDDNGHTLTCNSSSTSCDISGLSCGQAYNVSVTAMSVDCTGQRSEVRRISTAPCAPQSVVSQLLDCRTGDVQISWQSSKGAQIYYAQAKSSDKTLVCNSTSTSCIIPAIGCGQTYNITVIAEANGCSSNASVTSQVTAAPCPPLNIQSIMSCDSNTASVSWSSGNGALSFMMRLECSNGQTYICRTNETGCNITNMACGQTCTVKVVALGRSCNSSEGTGSPVITGPCVPQNVSASVSCSSNIASVTWGSSQGAELYTVTASSANGLSANCTSTSTSCNLLTLTCGQSYTITVKAKGSNCSSGNSAPVQVQAVPCTPSNVLPTVDCVTNALVVSWTPGAGGQYYTATLQDSNGLSTTCQSTGSQCNVTGLRCGQLYHVNVTASDGLCSSPPSATVNTNSVPCAASSIRAVLDCQLGTATVSWQYGAGAQGYAVSALALVNNRASCTSNSSITHCELSNLQCGNEYRINVQSLGYTCNASAQMTGSLITAPCLSTSVSAVVDCATDSVLVSWSAIAGAENYSVAALGSGGQRVSCSTSQNHCNISSLQCDQQFNLTFSSTNQQCQMTSTTNVTFQSRPCAPLQPEVNKLCGNKMSVMSWDLREGVAYYIARAVSAEGGYQLCNSTNSVCSFSTLGCGETYTFTVTAHRGQCQSDASAPVYLTTDPCKPENMTAHVSCDSETAALNWSKAKGASFYTLLATGSLGYIVDFSTTSTNLSVSLICGQSYSVTVQAHNIYCESQPSTPAVFRLAPCTPLNLVTYEECNNQLGSVSWGPSDGANMYTATAVGRDGLTHLCVTNGTSCTWEDLHCGEIYNITVTANDSHCTSARSNSTTIHMAPCVPQALLPILDCGTGVGTLSWASSAGAETYEVTAVSGDGNRLTFSTNITSGFLSGLLCGQQYQITVRAINRQCTSVLSSPAYLSSVPCVPQNVVSELDCLFNFINIRWNVSRGAASYLVVAKGPEGPVTACNTTAQQCRLQTLHCSSSYNVSVIAVNQQCNTSGSSILRINTVPCVPSHVQGSVNCTTGGVSVSWDPSVRAISYAAVAQTSGGYTSVCNTTGTACVFSDLLCGMNYSLAVSATDGTCNTAQSQPVVLRTVSCKPQNASAQLSCDTNSAVVSWEFSDNVTRHTVQATGSDGHRINCTSSNQSCTLSGMHCGQSYNITVTALDGVCDNSNKHLCLQSAPCAPSNVQTSLHCNISNGGVVSVSWVQANGAESYTAVAVSNDGHSYSCNTTAASCDLQELQCGQIYNVSVYSLARGCGRVKSTTSQVQTAPCPPQNVSAIVQCDLGSVLVSWNPAVDASQFRVELESESTGAISSCNSTNTQCSIAHLPCGERFNLSVVALRGSCQSQPSSDLSISSAPCIPQGVNGTVDCVTNSAWVSWDVDNGAESYTVLAVRDDGQNSTCSSSNSTCNVPDLGCGRSYTFVVTASNAACLSPPSNSFQLETAPCALSSIMVVAECHSSVIMVQWQRARSGKSLYIATAEDQDRSLLSCNSSTSSCNLTNVQCDKEYIIIVAASTNQCSSLRSPPYKIRTAPCQPSSVQANVDCQSKDVFVSWDPSYVAQSYLLTAVGRKGDLKTCNTSDNNCTLSDLRCSNTYYVSVLASNENCTSLPSANITFQTVPCEPANLTANIQCGNSSSASLSWAGSTGAVVYTGLAQSETGTTVYCETTHTSCILEGLVCGTVYNFTVQATDGLCNSSLSKPQTKGAAPCPPAGFRVVPRTVVNETQILRASWSTVNCPNSEYLLALTGSIQGNSQALFDLASYWTSRKFFEVPLPCGSSYSATISARSSAATSDKSAAITGTTVPCAPLNVTFSASLAEVGWNGSLFATNYTVYGVTSSGRTKLCMTSKLLCSVTNFSSGHIVVTASNTAGESEDSVPVSVTAGRRRR